MPQHRLQPGQHRKRVPCTLLLVEIQLPSTTSTLLPLTLNLPVVLYFRRIALAAAVAWLPLSMMSIFRILASQRAARAVCANRSCCIQHIVIQYIDVT